MKQTYKLKGKLIYDPPREGMKKTHRAQKGWLIVKVDDELGRYYRWHVRKFLGWILNGSAFGHHITVINDRDPDVSSHPDWLKYHNMNVEFDVDVKMERHWRFMILPVFSIQLDNIRTELGLGPKKGGLHITIGRI